MKIHVVGGGGREDALLWRLAQDGVNLSCAPGNGAAREGIIYYPTAQAEHRDQQVAIAQQEQSDLVVVGPEAPLVSGLADQLVAKGISVFGPTALAAEIEGSKIFCKRLLEVYGIPTASFEVFEDHERAIAYLEESRCRLPIVIKKDGLAAGKGVIVAHDRKTARQAVISIMEEKKFGPNQNSVVIEEFLEGRELTVTVLTDGETILPLPLARDYKRLFDGDFGPNTGGMGSFAPVTDVSPELHQSILKNIVQEIVDALAQEGRLYQGALYVGLMLTKDGPKVLECNCRFGDPETQVQLPLVEGNFAEALQAAAEGSLEKITLTQSRGSAVCVVLASYGYPWHYETGFPIKTPYLSYPHTITHHIFHAGTVRNEEGELVTAGGRVLGTVGIESYIQPARNYAYSLACEIKFTGKYYREDIAQ